MTSHKLFPSATLLVPESELEQYAHIHLPKATVPDSVMGISSLRNWLLQHFKEDAIIMLDDDISACVCMVSLRCRKLSVEETLQMLSNSAYNARGAGARLFGWHQRSDPRLPQRYDPFGVNHWVGGAVGVVRDANGGVPVWDELLKCKFDIDASLQELLDNREDMVLHAASHLMFNAEFERGLRDLWDIDLLFRDFTARSASFAEPLLEPAHEVGLAEVFR